MLMLVALMARCLELVPLLCFGIVIPLASCPGGGDDQSAGADTDLVDTTLFDSTDDVFDSRFELLGASWMLLMRLRTKVVMMSCSRVAKLFSRPMVVVIALVLIVEIALPFWDVGDCPLVIIVGFFVLLNS